MWRIGHQIFIHGQDESYHSVRSSVSHVDHDDVCPSRTGIQTQHPELHEDGLIHDMAESLVGDITPVDKDVTKEEKARREAAVMDYITIVLLGKVPGAAVSAQELRRVFQEYEYNETLEAHLVHNVDKVESLLQMVEYERSHKVPLDEFVGVVRRVQLHEMKAWAEQTVKERPTLE